MGQTRPFQYFTTMPGWIYDDIEDAFLIRVANLYVLRTYWKLEAHSKQSAPILDISKLSLFNISHKSLYGTSPVVDFTLNKYRNGTVFSPFTPALFYWD